MSLLTRASAPLALATACLFLVQATDAEAQRRRPRQSEGTEVTVQNRGQGALSFLYVAPVGEGAWGEDRLGSDTVARNRNFRFTIEGEQCRFDVRGVFENGREETRFGIDLCARPELVMNGRTQTTAADLQRQGPVALYLVRNRSGNTMQTLKLVSANGDESEDVLGSTTVETNSQYTGRFERNAGCVYDLVATFEGSSERTLRRRDLCANREVVFGTGGDDPAPRAGAEERRNEPDGQPPLAVTIQNRGAVAIQYLHIRPRGTNNWGPDRLGSDTVEARGTFQLSLPRRGCEYDV